MTSRIPLDRPTAIFGTTGAGKTFAAKGLVEPVIGAGARVCIVDPTGAWHGLRSAADGKSEGLPVVIFGGDHGDVPIGDDAGDKLGEIIASGRVLASIVDVSHFSTGETNRFLTAFFEALYQKNRGPLHLVMDEADAMAPQQPLPEQQRLKGAVNKIVRRGRIKGFRPMMITQRPAVLDKSVLSQIATLVALKLTSPQDRKAVEEWVKGNADADEARQVLGSLARLPVGEGWVWCPGEHILERTKFPPITTFDSSASPDEGWTEPEARAAVDVEALRTMFAASEISSTSDAAEKVSPAAIAAAEQRGYERGLVVGTRDGIKALVATLGHFHGELCVVAGILQSLTDHAGDIVIDFESPDEIADKDLLGIAGQDHHAAPSFYRASEKLLAARDAQNAEQNRKSLAERPASPAKQLKRPVEAAPKTEVSAGGLNSAARKMLAVLDTDPPVKRSWGQVATLAGLKARGGHFNAGRKALVESGLIGEDGGLVRVATPSAGASPAVRDPAALVEMWAGSLSGAAPKVLRHLFAVGGSRKRQAIADELGMQPRGGHWNAAWKELRDNAIVTVADDVATLTEMFRPNGGSRG